MVSVSHVEKYVGEVVRHFHPDRIVLFGSHATGTARKDSDVDLLVVMRHKSAAAEQAARIRCRIRAGFPLDIVVRSPAAIRKRLAMGDGFILDILERGKVLHESHGS